MYKGDEYKGKIQFVTSAEMPYLIYRACVEKGFRSITAYCQHAVIDALVRDLGLDRDTLVSRLPVPRTSTMSLMDPSHPNSQRIQGGVIQEVK